MSDLTPTGSEPDETPDINDELTHEQREVAGLTQSQIVRRRFFRHKAAMLALFTLLGIVVLSVTSISAGPLPGWFEYEHTTLLPNTPDDGPTMSAPEFLGGSGLAWGEHPFGLHNQRGRDLFAMTGNRPHEFPCGRGSIGNERHFVKRSVDIG